MRRHLAQRHIRVGVVFVDIGLRAGNQVGGAALLGLGLVGGGRAAGGWLALARANVRQRLRKRLGDRAQTLAWFAHANRRQAARLRGDLPADGVGQQPNLPIQRGGAVALDDQHGFFQPLLERNNLINLGGDAGNNRVDLAAHRVERRVGRARAEHRAHHHHLIQRRQQVDAKRICLLDELGRRAVASQQIKQAALAQGSAVAGHLLLQRLDVGAGLALFVDLLGDLAQGGNQVVRHNWLEQVLGHADLDRFLRILEFVVPAENNDLGGRERFAQDSAQLQAIHEWHFDVGDHGFGLALADQRQGHFAVGRFAAELVAGRRPVDGVADALAGDDLVFDQKDFVGHAVSSYAAVRTCAQPVAVRGGLRMIGQLSVYRILYPLSRRA